MRSTKQKFIYVKTLITKISKHLDKKQIIRLNCSQWEWNQIRRYLKSNDIDYKVHLPLFWNNYDIDKVKLKVYPKQLIYNWKIFELTMTEKKRC